MTGHALDSMAARQIAEADVRRILAQPLKVVPGNRPGRIVYEGIADVGSPALKALLRIVIDENVSPPAIITVYATTQFRRYGVAP